MRFNLQLPQLPRDPEKALGLLQTWLNQVTATFKRVVDNAWLGFGDGTNNDNIIGTWLSYTTNGTANTEDILTHNLGQIPIGFLVFSLSAAGVLYKGATAWTTTQMSIKCSVASVDVVIFVVPPSNTGA